MTTHTINTTPQFDVNKLVSRNRLEENIYKARITHGNQLKGEIHVREGLTFNFDEPKKLKPLIEGYQKDYNRASSDNEKSRLDAELAEKIILGLGLQIHFNSEYDHISTEEGAKQLKACLEGLRNVKGYENITQITQNTWGELVVAMAEETVVEEKPETKIDANTIATAMILAISAVLHLQWQKQEEQEELIQKLTEALSANATALTNLKATLESQNITIDLEAIKRLLEAKMNWTLTINWDSKNKRINEEITKKIEEWIKNWCQKFEDFFKTINKIIEKAATNNEKMTQKIDELTSKVDGLNTKIWQIQTNISTLKEKNIDLSNIENKLQEIIKKQTTLDNTIKRLKDNNTTDQSKDLSMIEQTIKDLTKEVSDLAEELEKLQKTEEPDQQKPDQDNPEKARDALKAEIESAIKIYDQDQYNKTLKDIMEYFTYPKREKTTIELKDLRDYIDKQEEDNTFKASVNEWIELNEKRNNTKNGITPQEAEKNKFLKEFTTNRNYKDKQALEEAIQQVQAEKARLQKDTKDDEEEPEVTENEIKEIIKKYDANTVFDNLNKIITYYKLDTINRESLSSRDKTKQEIETIKSSIKWDEKTDKDTRTWIENIIKRVDKQVELENEWKDENGNWKESTDQYVKNFCETITFYKSAKELLEAINAMDQFLNGKPDEEENDKAEIKALVETRTTRIKTIEENLQKCNMNEIWKYLHVCYNQTITNKTETLKFIKDDLDKISKDNSQKDIGTKINNLYNILSKEKTLYEFEDKFKTDDYKDNDDAQKWIANKKEQIEKLKTMTLDQTDKINQRCTDAERLIQEAEKIQPKQPETGENLPEIVKKRQEIIGKIETFTETGEDYVNAAIKLLEEQDAYNGKNVVEQLKTEVETLKQGKENKKTKKDGNQEYSQTIIDTYLKVDTLYTIISSVKELEKAKNTYQVNNKWLTKCEEQINRISNKDDNNENINTKKINGTKARKINKVDDLIEEAKQLNLRESWNNDSWNNNGWNGSGSISTDVNPDSDPDSDQNSKQTDSHPETTNKNIELTIEDALAIWDKAYNKTAETADAKEATDENDKAKKIKELTEKVKTRIEKNPSFAKMFNYKIEKKRDDDNDRIIKKIQDMEWININCKNNMRYILLHAESSDKTFTNGRNYINNIKHWIDMFIPQEISSNQEEIDKLFNACEDDKDINQEEGREIFMKNYRWWELRALAEKDQKKKQEIENYLKDEVKQETKVEDMEKKYKEFQKQQKTMNLIETIL